MSINNSRAVLGPNKDAQIAEQKYLQSMRARQGADRRTRWAFKKAMRQGDFQAGVSILQGAKGAGLDPFSPGSIGINSSEDQRRNARDFVRMEGVTPSGQMSQQAPGGGNRDLLDEPSGGQVEPRPASPGFSDAGSARDLLDTPSSRPLSFAEQDAAARERSYASGAFGSNWTDAAKDRTRTMADGFRKEDGLRRVEAKSWELRDEAAMRDGIYQAPPDEAPPLTPLEEGQMIADAAKARRVEFDELLQPVLDKRDDAKSRLEEIKGKALRDRSPPGSMTVMRPGYVSPRGKTNPRSFSPYRPASTF